MAQDPTQTPFAALRLDPRSTPEAITAAMRERAEEAEPDERRRLQGLWRQVTLHPRDRLRAALFSHAAPAARLDTRPGPLAPRRSPALPGLDPSAPPEVADLVVLPATRLAPRADGKSTPWPDVPPHEDVLLKL